MAKGINWFDKDPVDFMKIKWSDNITLFDSNDKEDIAILIILTILFGPSLIPFLEDNGQTNYVKLKSQNYVELKSSSSADNTDKNVIIPVVVSKPTPELLFDADIDTKAILYKKGDCSIFIKDPTRIIKQDAEVGNCTDSNWLEVNERLPNIVHTVVSTVVPPIVVPTVVPNVKPYENPWDFVKYAQNNWKYISKQKADIVQTPQESYRLLSGDCQDFSSMIAYYLQEVYRYDTVIVHVDLPAGPHLVAFVAADQSIWNGCSSYPTVFERNDKTYYPVDWQICPGWVWTSSGKLTLYEWNDISGHIHG